MVDVICQIDISTRAIIGEYKTRKEIFDKYPQFKKLATTLSRCLNGKQVTAYKFMRIYKSTLNNITLNNYIKSKIPNLMIDTHPHLIKEWNDDNTQNMYIITYGSSENILWNCLDNKNHSPYHKTVKERTLKYNYNKCPECYKEKHRVHDEKEKAEHIANHISDTKNMDIGDATECYIVKLLKGTNTFLNVIKIGETGDQCDIIVTLLSGIQKSIQVKTLLKRKNEDAYNLNLDNNDYPDNLLIVATNIERTRFSLFPFGYIGARTLTLSFKSGNTTYENIMYRDKNIFLKELINAIPNSIDYIMYNLCKEKTLERLSLARLRLWCLKRGFRYRRNDVDSNPIDCYINDIPIQAKYCSANNVNSLTYNISMHKSWGFLNGKLIKVPYSINDPFQYVIIEVGGIRNSENEKHIYENNFCIIPKFILEQRGVLENLPDIHGNGVISICPPDYSKDHWSKIFWNNYPFVQTIPKLNLI
jgi:hypothetical protein